MRPHVERRRSALPHRRAELQPRAVKVIALDAAERARGQGARSGRGTARAFSPRRHSAAAPRRARASPAGWLSDLAGRTKNLIDEVNSADLVVMVATAGENAQAASIIGEACSAQARDDDGAGARRRAIHRRGAVEDALAAAAVVADAGRQRRGVHRRHADRAASIGSAMHDVSGQTHWHEPAAGQRAGFGKFGRPKTPYDLFMESEGIPIFRDIGVSKVQNLPLAPWNAAGRTRHLYPALRHRRQMGLLCRRGAGRRRAQRRKASL